MRDLVQQLVEGYPTPWDEDGKPQHEQGARSGASKRMLLSLQRTEEQASDAIANIILYSPGLLGCGPLLGLKSYGREEPLLFYLWGMLQTYRI